MLMYLGLIVAPITLYMYAAHPSWTWMYWVNPENVPSFALLPLVVGHCVMLVLGWYVGAKLVLAKQLKVAQYISMGGIVLALLGILIFWGRLTLYGTYSEFQQGRALDLMEVKLGYVLVALVIGSLASALYVALELLRDSRRVRSH